MRRGNTSLIFGIASFLIPLVVYGLTLCPTVSFVDAGELCVTSRLLGIAHPTGYPIYVLLGRLFSLIPVGTVIQRTNFLSALFAALAAFFLYLAIGSLLDRNNDQETKNAILAFFCSASFAFSTTLWSSAVVTEVYTLTALLGSILLFLTFSDLERGSLLFAYVFGVSLTNHMSILLVGIPCGVYLMAARKVPVRRIPLVVLLFILGLSTYCYLPVRAAHAPLMNWGDPSNLERFIWHVTGKQYRVWMFNLEPAVLKANLVHLLRLLSDQYTLFLLWLPVLGLFAARNSRPLKVVIAIFALDILYSLNYDIPDIDAYYIPAFMAMAVASAFGLRFLFARAKRLLLLLLGVVVPLVPLTAHYYKCDMSRNRIAYDYAANYLGSIDREGLCLTNNWDIYSPCLYIQHIERKRTDVILIDKELLRRSWYFDFLAKRYPETYAMSAREIESYLEELYHFEHGTLESPDEIQNRFIDMLNSLVLKQMRRGSAYTTFINGHDLDAPHTGKGFRKVPHGLVYEFNMTGEHTPFDWTSLSLEAGFDVNVYRDDRTRSNLTVYTRMMTASGIGLFREGKLDHARAAFEQALRLDSENLTAKLNLAGTYLMLGEYDLALKAFQQVLAQDPRNRMALDGLDTARKALTRQ